MTSVGTEISKLCGHGDKLTLNNCQNISFRLSIFGNYLLSDFRRELNVLLLSTLAPGLPADFSATKVFVFESA